MNQQPFAKLLLSLFLVAQGTIWTSEAAFLRGNQTTAAEQIQHQTLDANYVAQSIANHLWKGETVIEKPTFIIAGSFASAVQAYQNDKNFVLEYNDIDVWVDSRSDDCGSAAVTSALHYENIIPNVEVHIVEVCGGLDLDSLVSKLDINAVMVGFQVVGDSKSDTAGSETKARIEKWSLAPQFRDFLDSHTLDIEDTNENGLRSVLRLFRKAQQLGLDYRIRDEEEMKARLTGSTMRPYLKKWFEDLDDDLQEEITSRFDILSDGGRHHVLKHKNDDSSEDELLVQRSERRLKDWFFRYYYGDSDDEDDPVIDPVRVCVNVGNTPDSDYAWSVRVDNSLGDIVAQKNDGGVAEGNCRIVDCIVGRPYYFRMFDRSGLGEASAYVENNGQRIVDLPTVPATVEPIQFMV